MERIKSIERNPVFICILLATWSFFLKAQYNPQQSHPQEAILFDKAFLKRHHIREITESRRFYQSADSFVLHLRWSFDKMGRLHKKYRKAFMGQSGQNFSWTYTYFKDGRLSRIEQHYELDSSRIVRRYNYTRNKGVARIYASYFIGKDSSGLLETILHFGKGGLLQERIQYQNDTLEEFRQHYTYNTQKKVKTVHTQWPPYRLEWVDEERVADEEQVDSDTLGIESEARAGQTDSLDGSSAGRWLYRVVKAEERTDHYHYDAQNGKCTLYEQLPADQYTYFIEYHYGADGRLKEQVQKDSEDKRTINRLSFEYDKEGRLLRMLEYYGESIPVSEYLYSYRP